MNISRLEQETIILFNEEEATAEVYTYNGRFKRRLEQMSLQFPSDVKLTRACPTGSVTYELPYDSL